MSVNTYTPDSTKIIHNTSVDFITRYINTPVHLVQYDNTSPIIAVKLYSNGTPYAIPSGADVNVRIKKPDGTFVYNPVLGCDSARTTVYVEATTQMCAVDGEIYPIVEIKMGANIAASGYFHTIVDKNPVSDSDIVSSDEGKAVKEYVDLSKSWAVGGTGVRTGEDTDNSKYYAQLSNKSQTDALANANDAKTAAAGAKTSETNAAAQANAAQSYANSANTSANSAAAQATNAKNSASAALVSETNARGSATAAAGSASDANASAIESESWAVGGTGTRAGEDTDNAKYWAQQAQATSKINIATPALAGIVKPDDVTITVDPDGTIHGTGAGDEVTIVKDASGKLSVPIDNSTIYIGGDGKMRATGGSGAANIEDITLLEYEAKKAAGSLDHNKYYAITDDTEPSEGGEGKGIIPITKADYDELTRLNPDLKKGKTYQIIDDYDDPELATDDKFGMVKLCSDPDVSGDGLALPTSEKDSTKSGTLANLIKLIKDKLGTATLATTNKDVSGAINELNEKSISKIEKKSYTVVDGKGLLNFNLLTLNYELVSVVCCTNEVMIIPFPGNSNAGYFGKALKWGDMTPIAQGTNIECILYVKKKSS